MGIGRGSADFRWKKKKSLPPKIKRSAEKKFRKKMQGCFMQFLRLIFVKKLQLQGASPPDPHRVCCPWTPTEGLLRPPGPHFSADFSILNSHAWEIFNLPKQTKTKQNKKIISLKIISVRMTLLFYSENVIHFLTNPSKLVIQWKAVTHFAWALQRRAWNEPVRQVNWSTVTNSHFCTVFHLLFLHAMLKQVIQTFNCLTTASTCHG